MVKRTRVKRVDATKLGSKKEEVNMFDLLWELIKKKTAASSDSVHLGRFWLQIPKKNSYIRGITAPRSQEHPLSFLNTWRRQGTSRQVRKLIFWK